ncbi:hypothetical protein BD779DRAFT_1570200 [Infundibulicybe gibba]|nr:hypothetical protein BD779DRAFT_1570200 [Infundibulicybe gibba]
MQTIPIHRFHDDDVYLYRRPANEIIDRNYQQEQAIANATMYVVYYCNTGPHAYIFPDYGLLFLRDGVFVGVLAEVLAALAWTGLAHQSRAGNEC